MLASGYRRTGKPNISKVLELAGLVVASTACHFPRTKLHIGVNFVAIC